MLRECVKRKNNDLEVLSKFDWVYRYPKNSDERIMPKNRFVMADTPTQPGRIFTEGNIFASDHLIWRWSVE